MPVRVQHSKSQCKNSAPNALFKTSQVNQSGKNQSGKNAIRADGTVMNPSTVHAIGRTGRKPLAAPAMNAHSLVQLRNLSARCAREQAGDQSVNEARGRGHEQGRGKAEGRALVFEIALSDRMGVIQEPALKHDASSDEASIYLQIRQFSSQTIHQIGTDLGNYSMTPLDSIDIRILALLQRDASCSISEIGDAVHLSQNACWRRIKRLEDEGVIKKRVALLDPQKLDVGVTVFVSVRVGEHSEKWLETFTALVRKMPEVIEFYRMAGDVDYLLKLQVADIPAYDRVYKSLIHAAKLMDVSAAFAMEEMKRTTELPLPRPD